MSEEPTPTPSLRLKPRLRPTQPETSAIDASAVVPELTQAAGADVTSSSAGRAAVETTNQARLKPQLAAENTATQPFVSGERIPTVGSEPSNIVLFSDAAPDALPKPVPPPRPAPILFKAPESPVIAPPAPGTTPAVVGEAPAAPAAAAPGDAGKFKLKPKSPPALSPPPAGVGLTPPPEARSPGGAPASLAPAHAPATVTEQGATPPRFPVVAPSAEAKPVPAPPPLELKKLAPPPALPEPSPVITAAPPRRGRKIGIFTATGLLAIAGAFWGWRVLYSPPPVPVPANGKRPASTAKAAVPAADVTTPSAPRDPAAHVVPSSQATVQTTAAHAPALTTTSAPARPAVKPVPVATAVTELAPGVLSSAAIATQNQSSPEARAFIANARIAGVVSGSSPRLLINGRLVRGGDVVDSTLGITFDSVRGNELVFKDRKGVVLTRRY